MTHSTSDLRSVFVLILAAACWGIGAVITKSVLASIPPITLLLIQLAFSVSLLWTVVLVKRRRLLGKKTLPSKNTLPSKKRLLGIGLLGVMNPGISYTFSLFGLSMTTASMSTLLWATEPILIIGLAWVILREKPVLRPGVLVLPAGTPGFQCKSGGNIH
jgi:drug/metabolite transporter (DMT)-like permease